MKIQIWTVTVKEWGRIMINSTACHAMVLEVVVVESAFATKIVLGNNVNAILYSAVRNNLGHTSAKNMNEKFRYEWKVWQRKMCPRDWSWDWILQNELRLWTRKVSHTVLFASPVSGHVLNLNDKQAKVSRSTEPQKCAAVQPKLKIVKVKTENNVVERNKVTVIVTNANAMNFILHLTIQEFSHAASLLDFNRK